MERLTMLSQTQKGPLLRLTAPFAKTKKEQSLAAASLYYGYSVPFTGKTNKTSILTVHFLEEKNNIKMDKITQKQVFEK